MTVTCIFRRIGQQVPGRRFVCLFILFCFRSGWEAFGCGIVTGLQYGPLLSLLHDFRVLATTKVFCVLVIPLHAREFILDSVLKH